MIKRVLRIMYNEQIEIIILMLSIFPLFFTNYSYETNIYLYLFLYFLGDFIRRIHSGEYKENNKAYLVTDLLGLISFVEVYHILILFRLFRVVKLLLKVKGIRFILKIYVNNFEIIKSLILVAFGYMLLSSLILYNVEPQTFGNNFLNAFYWSGITLTTVGYGDVYPVTMIGKFIGLISSFVGIGIIALPTGFIAGEFLNYINESKRGEKE